MDSESKKGERAIEKRWRSASVVEEEEEREGGGGGVDSLSFVCLRVALSVVGWCFVVANRGEGASQHVSDSMTPSPYFVYSNPYTIPIC